MRVEALTDRGHDGSAGASSDRREQAQHRFRKIFDALNSDHGRQFPTWRPTAGALHPPQGQWTNGSCPVNLGRARLPLRLLIVPGLGASLAGALGQPLPDAAAHVRRLGYAVDLLEVGGLTSSRRNARLLNHLIAGIEHDPAERIVVLGYSKGAVDALVALASHPALAERVTAMVSLAGSIGGSILVDDLPDAIFERGARLRRWLPLGGLKSLESRRRQRWLESAALPAQVRLYNLVSHARRPRISGVLRASYERLRWIDARNDGQVLARHQVVPGSTLLAELNADHWAVALPLAQRHPWLRRVGLGANDYPREILLEAVLKHIEEDLLDPRTTGAP
ncbi:MAG TPA: hypothetical protein VFZ01_02830 [Geminicoccaceae bacterium]